MVKKKVNKWIQKAISHPGQLHRDLGIPEGEKIPIEKVRWAAQQPGKLGQRGRLALRFAKHNYPVAHLKAKNDPSSRKAYILEVYNELDDTWMYSASSYEKTPIMKLVKKLEKNDWRVRVIHRCRTVNDTTVEADADDIPTEDYPHVSITCRR